MSTELPGRGDYMAWPSTNHPMDPRTPDESDFDLWEEGISYWDILDAGTIDSVLYALRHGNPEQAKQEFTTALQAEYQKTKLQEAA